MLVSYDPHSSYFYFYLLFVKDMTVIFPFSMDFLRVLNATHSQLFPNSWAYTNAFEKACDDLVITPIVRVFFSFYNTKSTKGSWVTLSIQYGKFLFLYHSNHFKYWKDKFAHVMG